MRPRAVLVVSLLGSTVLGLRLNVDGYLRSRELSIAAAAAAAAGVQLLGARNGQRAAASVLADALASTAAVGSQWVWHADDCTRSVAIALISTDEEEVTLSLVHCPERQETAFATLSGGAYVLRGDEEEASDLVAGGAGAQANVVHLPPGWAHSPQYLDVAEHLQSTGVGMPLLSATVATAAEGLLDVVLSRADVYLSPPAGVVAGQGSPPPQVLAALDLLLSESGGTLVDIHGEPIVDGDLLAAIALGGDGNGGGGGGGSSSGGGSGSSGGGGGGGGGSNVADSRGLLACVEVMQPYFSRAIAPSFPRHEASACALKPACPRPCAIIPALVCHFPPLHLPFPPITEQHVTQQTANHGLRSRAEIHLPDHPTALPPQVQVKSIVDWTGLAVTSPPDSTHAQARALRSLPSQRAQLVPDFSLGLLTKLEGFSGALAEGLVSYEVVCEEEEEGAGSEGGEDGSSSLSSSS